MAAPDFSRTKNALIGCLGLTAVAFAGLYVTMQRRMTRRPTAVAVPCVRWDERLRPVLVGDSATLLIRSIQNASDCSGKAATDFVWSTSNNDIVDITPEGVVRGKRPGMFEAMAQRGRDTLRTDGFVLPPEWRARIEPDSATIHVGDTVRMVMRAVDKGDAPLPKVPFSIFTPEFFDPASRKKPLVNRASWQNTLDPVIVVGTDTGTTILVGRIGFQQVAARLTIRAR